MHASRRSPTRYDCRLGSKEPSPCPPAGRAEHVADPRFTTATLETRVPRSPGAPSGTTRTSSWRPPPTWDPLDDAPTAPVLTNLSKIQRAIERSPRVTRTTTGSCPLPGRGDQRRVVERLSRSRRHHVNAALRRRSGCPREGTRVASLAEKDAEQEDYWVASRAG